MTRFEFDRGIDLLAMEYEKELNLLKRDSWYEDLQGRRGEDWAAAIRRILDDPNRASFPRIGMLKAVLGEVEMHRGGLEWADRKRDFDINNPMNSDMFDVALGRLRRMLRAVSDGKEACNALAIKFAGETKIACIEPSSGCGAPNCHDGYVPITVHEPDGKRSFSGWCSICKRPGKLYGLKDCNPYDVSAKADLDAQISHQVPPG